MKQKDIIIFDIDRTIYDGSIGQDFIIELINEKIISPKILASLSFEIIEYELDIQNYSKTVKDILKTLNNELLGKDLKQVQEIAQKVIQYNHYKFYDYIFELPSLYKEFDYVLLSLEPDFLVSEIASYLKIPFFISNNFGIKNGLISNSNKITTNKFELFEDSKFKNRNIIAAFGDSENDLGILDLAKLKLVINPTPNLLQKISHNNNFKVINPKIATDEFKKNIINFI
jgi:phosphoserine phosphatase